MQFSRARLSLGNLPLSCRALFPYIFRLSVKQVDSRVALRGSTLTTASFLYFYYRPYWTHDTGVEFAYDGIRASWKIYCIETAYPQYASATKCAEQVVEEEENAVK